MIQIKAPTNRHVWSIDLKDYTSRMFVAICFLRRNQNSQKDFPNVKANREKILSQIKTYYMHHKKKLRKSHTDLEKRSWGSLESLEIIRMFHDILREYQESQSSLTIVKWIIFFPFFFQIIRYLSYPWELEILLSEIKDTEFLVKTWTKDFFFFIFNNQFILEIARTSEFCSMRYFSFKKCLVFYFVTWWLIQQIWERPNFFETKCLVSIPVCLIARTRSFIIFNLF